MDDAELRRLAAAATPGPWEYREMVEPGSAGVTHPHGWVDAVIACGANEMRDAAYIAAANPATMLALLDRLEKAEKDAARYRLLASRMVHVFHPAGAGWTLDEVLVSGDRDLDETVDALTKEVK